MQRNMRGSKDVSETLFFRDKEEDDGFWGGGEEDEVAVLDRDTSFLHIFHTSSPFYGSRKIKDDEEEEEEEAEILPPPFFCHF